LVLIWSADPEQCIHTCKHSSVLKVVFSCNLILTNFFIFFSLIMRVSFSANIYAKQAINMLILCVNNALKPHISYCIFFLLPLNSSCWLPLQVPYGFDLSFWSRHAHSNSFCCTDPCTVSQSWSISLLSSYRAPFLLVNMDSSPARIIHTCLRFDAPRYH